MCGVLLLLAESCTGQQCSPASTSFGMIIPTTDLPSEGTPHVCMFCKLISVCLPACRSEAVLSGGRGGYT